MLIIKLALSIAIISITTYIGFTKSYKLKNREYILKDISTFLKLVKNEMNYNMNILPNAYEAARQKLRPELKDAIGAIVVDMLKEENSNILDYSIVDNISKIEGLTDYDKNIIISTFRNLGRSDLESQINIIDNSIDILENQIKEANEIKLTNEKMYKNMGVIVGIMIVVIFI